MARTKRNININDMSTWPIVLTLVFCLVIVSALIYLVKIVFVDDVVNEISSKDSAIVAQRKIYTKNVRDIALLPHIRKEVAELGIARDEAKKYLPTQVSMPSLIDNVYVSARNNGIIFDSFKPEKDVETEFYTIKPISLSAKVGYISMSNFIEEVTTLKRIMNINSVNFKVENTQKIPDRGSNDPLEMTAQLRTYIFKDSHDDK